MSIGLRDKAYKLLRRSEGIFKTDMVYAAKGGFWLTFGQGIATFSSFILAIAFANILSQEEYGTYKYILSLTGLISSISLSGLSTSVVRSVARGFEGSFMQSFYLSLRWGLLMALSAFALSIYYYVNGNNLLAVCMLFTGAFSPLIDSGELYNAFLNGKKAFKGASLMRGIRSLITTLALVIGVLFTKNIAILIAIYFISHTITVCLLFYITYKTYKPNDQIEPDTVRLGKHVSIMNFLSTVSDRIDSVLVFHYFGAAQLAIYSFSLLIPNNILGLIKNIGTLATPKFVNHKPNEVRVNILRKSLSLLYVTLPIALSYILLAPIFFKVFFPAYIESVIYSQVFAITILMSGVIPLSTLDAHVAIRKKYILSLISNVSKLVLMFIGIYFAGIWGAIFGRIFSKSIGLFTAFILARSI